MCYRPSCLKVPANASRLHSQAGVYDSILVLLTGCKALYSNAGADALSSPAVNQQTKFVLGCHLLQQYVHVVPRRPRMQ